MIGWTLTLRRRRRLSAAADRVSGLDGNDRLADARTEIEPGLSTGRSEQARIAAQACGPFRLAVKDPESRECGGRDRRRHSDAVNESARRMLQEVDQRRAAGDESAAGGERLRQRAHPDVDPSRIQAEMLEYASVLRSQNAQAVRVVISQA